jgi:hypothetical protein
MNLAQKRVEAALKSVPIEEFIQRDITFFGDEACLITPGLPSVEWTQENKFLRSLIYRKSDFQPLSCGFPKFVNFGENPGNFPPPTDLLDSRIVSKEDGSLMIVDACENMFNVRTRGTESYVTLDNSADFDVALDKYYNIRPWMQNHTHLSLLFEIVTPNQRIVLDYPEIDLYLIGAINKNTYELESQVMLDSFAMEMLVPRPKKYEFNDLSELLSTIEKAFGIEGCVIYQGNDLWKVKSAEYLKLHSFKSNATEKNILNLYADQDFPSFKAFKKYIKNTFDYECWCMVEELVQNLDEVKKSVDVSINKIDEYAQMHKNLSDKDFAFLMQMTYRNPWKDVAFKKRKGMEIPNQTIKKIIKSVLDEK